MLPEAKSSVPVKGIFAVNCSKPYNLTKGCNKKTLADFVAVVEERNFAFSSSADGKILYITEPLSPGLTKGLVSAYSLGAIDIQTNSLNSDVLELKKLFAGQGIGVVEVRPHVIRNITSSYVAGYFLLLDGDGYKVLSKHIVE